MSVPLAHGRAVRARFNQQDRLRLEQLIAAVPVTVQRDRRNLIGNVLVDPSTDRLVSVAVIRDCVVTSSRVGWLYTNKTGHRRVAKTRAVMAAMRDSFDQRLMRPVDVRIESWYCGLRRGLVWNYTAYQMSAEPFYAET